VAPLAAFNPNRTWLYAKNTPITRVARNLDCSNAFATVHVVGSNNDLEPWSGLFPDDSCSTPCPDRIAEFERRTIRPA